MNQSKKSGPRSLPTISRSLKEEVLEYFQNQGGEVKETSIYIHFVLEHHEEIPDILEEFAAEGFIQPKGEGHLLLTTKGKKTLQRLRESKG